MKTFLLLLILLLAACSGTPETVGVVPSLAALPTETPSPIPPSETATQVPTLGETPFHTLTHTATLAPSSTPTDTSIPPTATASPTETPIPSETFTALPSQTFTPSLTITNTITPTASMTFTPTLELDGLGMLAMLIERATVLPPELMYNPPTLTAVAHAAETLIAGGGVSAGIDGSSPTPVSGTPVFGTLPPINLNCAATPPPSLTTADSTLLQFVGCPQGALSSTASAVQSFERGSMLYLQGSPNYIYVLTLDGRFRRYDDTWMSGIDPEAGNETPPLGLLEPRRGFGKVWRDNLDARGALGWAINEEQGGNSPLQLFEHGRAVFLPQRGLTYVLSDDPGGLSGTWRTLPASF